MTGGYDGSGTFILCVLVLAWLTVVAVDAVAAQGVESDGCWDDVFCEMEVARKLCLRHHHAARSPDVCVYRRSSSGEEGLHKLSKEDLQTLRDSRLSVKSRIIIRKRTPVSSIGMAAQTLERRMWRTTCNFRSFYTLIDPDSMGKQNIDFTSTPSGVFNQITCRNNTTVSSGSVPSTTTTTTTRMPDSAASSDHAASATATATTEDSPPNNTRCKEQHNRWKAKGYVHEENIIFKIFWKKVTWATARNICRIDGGRLLVLSDINKFHNLGKTSFIDRVLKKTADVNRSIIMQLENKFRNEVSFHLGANDLEEEGHFKWIDGNDLKSEGVIWVDEQPDNFEGKEDCVTLQVLKYRQKITRKYGLNDAICSLEYWFICEILPCENSD